MTTRKEGCTSAAERVDCLNPRDLPTFGSRQRVPCMLWVLLSAGSQPFVGGPWAGLQESSLLPKLREQAEMQLVLRKEEHGGGG